MRDGQGLIITGNGGDATMSVIRQDGPDRYRLVETILTRPITRGLALDEQSRRLFTVTASVTRPALMARCRRRPFTATASRS